MAVDAKQAAARAQATATAADEAATRAQRAVAGTVGAVEQMQRVLVAAASGHANLATRIARLESEQGQLARAVVRRPFPAATRLPAAKAYITGTSTLVGDMAEWFGFDRSLAGGDEDAVAGVTAADLATAAPQHESPALAIVRNTTSSSADGSGAGSQLALEDAGEATATALALRPSTGGGEGAVGNTSPPGTSPRPSQGDGAPSLRYLVLNGVGGVGKTTTAAE